MLNGLSKTQKAAIFSAAVALIYIIITLILASSWKGSVSAFMAGASSADGNSLSNPDVMRGLPDLPFLLKILMRPIPAATGGGLTSSWPILLQGIFIFGTLLSFFRWPMYGTLIASLAVLWLILFLISGSFGISIFSVLLYGVPFICLLGVIGTFLGKQLR